jgi:2-isopropylmalate synthase
MKPELLDTTLREGEQTPGVSFTKEQKLEIAQLLDVFGVDVIEVGHPVVSPDIMAAAKLLVRQKFKAKMLAHCRAQIADIDAALACGVDMVGIFFSVTDKSLEQRFRRSEAEATALIVKAVEYAKQHGLQVRYTPEDTVRSDFAKVVRVSNAAIAAGADRISVADTAGIMTPLRMHDFITRLRENITVPINVHCHNDLGMATANSLSAIEAGASMVDVTVNGLGERTGIPSLAEVSTALKLAYGHEANWHMEHLPQLSAMVEKYSGIPISQQAPIVGRNAFTHNAGLHVSAVLLDPSHYESIPCEMVGRMRDIVIDKMSSKDAIVHKTQMLGLTLTSEQLHSLWQHIKTNGHNMVDNTRLKMLAMEIVNGRLKESTDSVDKVKLIKH